MTEQHNPDSNPEDTSSETPNPFDPTATGQPNGSGSPDPSLSSSGLDTSAAAEPLTITWKDQVYHVVASQYVENTNTCLCLLDKDGRLEAKASVNVGVLPPYQMYIKDYSENRGILAALRAAKLVEPTGEVIKNGSAEFIQVNMTAKLALCFGIDLPEPESPFDFDPSLGQHAYGDSEPQGSPALDDETEDDMPDSPEGFDSSVLLDDQLQTDADAPPADPNAYAGDPADVSPDDNNPEAA